LVGCHTQVFFEAVEAGISDVYSLNVLISGNIPLHVIFNGFENSITYQGS
jgi:hypothetical protein